MYSFSTSPRSARPNSMTQRLRGHCGEMQAWLLNWSRVPEVRIENPEMQYGGS